MILSIFFSDISSQQAVGTTVVVGKESLNVDQQLAAQTESEQPIATSTLTICSSHPNSPKPEPIPVAAAMLNFVPTVNRVSIPVPPASTIVTAVPASTIQSVESIVPADSWVSGVAASPDPTTPDDVVEQNNSVDSSSLIPTTTAAEDKLLNADAEAGVSEFLPCADFMGPGVSPSPCFSLSDSPLGKIDFFKHLCLHEIYFLLWWI